MKSTIDTYNNWRYILVNSDDIEVMRGGDKELADMVNYVYEHDGAYILDSRGNVVDC